MKKMILTLLTFTTLLFAEAIDRTGPYLALGGGYATFYDAGRLGATPLESTYNVNFIGGVFINRYLSVEFGFDYYDTFENEAGDTTKIYTFEAIAKAHYPFWRNRIDLYAAFGAGGMEWHETLDGYTQDDNSGVVSGDIGVGLRAIEWLTFNLGYRRYFFTLDHAVTATKTTEAQIIRHNMELGSVYANIEVQF